ncbi:unnamed protein product [Candidula unifasciata]|uniref:Peptidase M14 domain-containing protein n=1 Tax=Candidula unifasciata TaxID=100452 RepID=A0A8S3YBI3_9EUPU|nr:unnamed protein product [Candidula unifasciata]
MNSDIKYRILIAWCTFVLIIFQQNVRSEKITFQKENYTPDYSFYHNVTSIVSHMTKIVNKYGKYINLKDEFRSKAGHSQLVIRISNFTSEKSGRDKVQILFAFGEHAREFFPVESMFYFLKNLTRGLDELHQGSLSGAYSAWVVNNFDIYIIGMTNPDGRYYLEESGNYCWRGTGSGIDLNRNFDWNFAGPGSSKDSHDEEFRGPRPFSEPETGVFIKLAAKISFDAFLSFHSGIRQIYLPFADTKSKQQNRLPENIDHMLKLARRMSHSSPSRPFQFGLAHRLIDYSADGTSFDYMAGVASVPFSLAVEMWGHENHTGSSCFDEFNPRSEHLQEEVALVHPLYVEMLSYLLTWKTRKSAARNRASSTLIRVRKDNSLNSEHQQDVLYASQTSREISRSASFESQIIYVIFALVVTGCVILGVRHTCQLMRKKRIVSLKSLSLTFSLCKHL